MTNTNQTTLIANLRRGWHRTVEWGCRHHALRNIYYGAYALFFCGFLFFPSSKSHNNFFYATLLVPSLIILWHLFAAFLQTPVFKLMIAYLAYLVLTNFWGVNVTLENVAEQIKHILYVLAFITASIVVEADYHEKADRLLPAMASIAAVVFLVNTLWWYQSHPFPVERLANSLGRLDNPIFAGCLAGMACLVLVDMLQWRQEVRVRLAAGIAFGVNLMFIMLSQSRTALAALAPALLVLFLPHIRRHGRLMMATGAVLLAMAIALQDVLIFGFTRNSYRLDVWLATLEKVRSHIWWGQGYFCDTFAIHIGGRDMQHAHNVFLAALRDGGLAGLLLLIALVAAAGWSALQQGWAAKRYLNLALITFGVIAVSLDNDRLVANPEELWVFFWYPLGRIMARDLVCNGHWGQTTVTETTTGNTNARRM